LSAPPSMTAAITRTPCPPPRWHHRQGQYQVGVSAGPSRRWEKVATPTVSKSSSGHTTTATAPPSFHQLPPATCPSHLPAPIGTHPSQETTSLGVLGCLQLATGAVPVTDTRCDTSILSLAAYWFSLLSYWFSLAAYWFSLVSYSSLSHLSYWSSLRQPSSRHPPWQAAHNS